MKFMQSNIIMRMIKQDLPDISALLPWGYHRCVLNHMQTGTVIGFRL